MTTIQQLMQTGPLRANEIFAKLAETPVAAKTCDRLVSDLKVELDRQAEFEEQRLFPVLREHKETKDLVAGAMNDSQQMRKLLVELERSPKDSEAFSTKVADLRDLFQGRLRDDKDEILPAVVKALNDEEARTYPAQQNPQVARRAMRGGTDTSGERDRPPVGSSMMQLLNEQALQALQVQTAMTAGRVRMLAEVIQVQSAFMAGSFQRMAQFNNRYFAFIRSWRDVPSFPSDRR